MSRADGVRKAATDAVCEIMEMSGHACSPEADCWHRAECDEAQHMARKLAALDRRETEEED